ncbi:MAG: bifunctional alpha/beta hydrolase/OsmC family protein [Pseudomonadota bacterium]
MPTERFTFQGHDGANLAAKLDMPDGPLIGTALFAHCFTCGKDMPVARRIASRLAAAGIAVLRFDFTGLGSSEGEFARTTFSSNVADLYAAQGALIARGMAPSLLIGHSLGGAAVLRAASDMKGIKAVVTLGAPFDPGHVTHNFQGSLGDIAENGEAEVMLGGRPIKIGQEFVEDVEAESLQDAIRATRAAHLILHAPTDNVVGIENAEQIFRAARHPKSFVTLDTADHLITDGEDAEYAAEVIAAWSGRYLDLPKLAAPIGAPEGVVRVSEADPNGFLQDINHGATHHALADEPIAYGGTNRGMTPYGFLAAGLGACTSMTIRMYARRKKWALSHVYVDVTHDKVHGQDAELMGGSGKLDHFMRHIHLEGDLSEEQRQKLLEIADKCPVHRSLEASSVVKTKLIAADAPRPEPVH